MTAALSGTSKNVLSVREKMAQWPAGSASRSFRAFSADSKSGYEVTSLGNTSAINESKSSVIFEILANLLQFYYLVPVTDFQFEQEAIL